MDRKTFDSVFLLFINQKPFRPFTVFLVNGDRLEVDHANALAVRNGVGAFVGPGGVPAMFDHEGVAQLIGDLASRPQE